MYQDIPRIYTGIAEILSCTVYICMVNAKRVKQIGFWFITVAVMTLQCAFLALTDDVPVAWWIPCMAVAIFIMWGFIRLICGMKLWPSVYICSFAFVLAECIASWEWQIDAYMQRRLVGTVNPRTISFVSVAMIFSGCIVAVYYGSKKSFTSQELSYVGMRDALIVEGFALIVFAFGNLSFVVTDTPFTTTITSDIFMIRSLADLVGVAVLFAYHNQMRERRAATELAKMDAMLQSQYDQYRIYQESLDQICVKCHDLKHQVLALQVQTDEKVRGKWIKDLSDEIDDFYVPDNTGCAVLDTIIAAKRLVCRKNHIQLTCVADGKILNEIHVKDICSIFGNALDNAIESVMTLPEEQRLIHMNVENRRNFIYIKVENYIADASIHFNADNLIDTTKENPDGGHGYGLKSIRRTAEKYHGTMEISGHEGWFELKVLLPNTLRT